MKKLSISNIPLSFLLIGYFIILIPTIVIFARTCSPDELVSEKSKEIKEQPIEKEKEKRHTIEYQEAQNFNYLNHSFSAFVFDASKHDISFYYLTEEGNEYTTFNNVQKATQEKGNELIFATNAGIFTQKNEPEGLFINDGNIDIPLNLKNGKGNFYLKPNGVFFIKKNGKVGILESQEYFDKEMTAQYATQSGPLLLRNGMLHPAINEGSKNRFIRNGVGVISPTKAVFLISNEPINYYDFSMTFKEKFNCKDALYLDGAISEMFLPEVERMNKGGDFSGIIGVSTSLE